MYTVAVVTGTRAEYGLLRPVIQKMAASELLRPRLLITGSHLSRQHGDTIREIEADGFEIAALLDILSTSVPDGRAGTAQRTTLALQLFVNWLQQPFNRPDALLLLGDRYEALAAGQAAALLDIPLVHISGGDVTAGADDDWYRHCLTKMAKLHFPSTEVYRRRIIRMGEAPNRVFNVGGLGDENIRSLQLLSLKTLARGLELDLERPYALVTMHPETMSRFIPADQIDILLKALERHPQLFYLFTAANADAGGEVMNKAVKAWCAARPNAAMVASLGTLRYLSAMKYAALVIGNSSSGVVETPTLGVPTVDIGNRQAGRVTGGNVLHCSMGTAAIAEAMDAALQPEFAASARQTQSPYYGKDTSGRIVEILEQFLDGGQLQFAKTFYDGGTEE